MPSFSYKVLIALLKCLKIKNLYKMTAQEFEQFYQKRLINQSTEPDENLKRVLDIEKIEIDNRPFYSLSPKNSGRCLKAILFVHGGGYFTEMDSMHWNAAKRMSLELDAKVYVPAYGLIPNHTALEAMAMLEKCYKHILLSYKARNVIFFGDSAGAQIILSFSMLCKSLNLPQPKRIVLVSPPVDMAPTQEIVKKMEEMEKRDCILSTKVVDMVPPYWAKGLDLKDYRVSPIYGDFSDLAPITIFCGTEEIFYVQIRDLVLKAEEKNVKTELHIGEGMLHAWPLYKIAKESKEGLTELINLFRKE